jgi:hypothetical protein
MQPRPFPSARRALRAIAGRLALSVLALALVVEPVLADDTQPRPAGSAMRMYRDPQSGRLGSPPAGAFADTADSAPEARTTAVEDPGAEAVELPGGGVKINLRGRYRSAVTRHLGPSGPTGHACTEAGAAADE